MRSELGDHFVEHSLGIRYRSSLGRLLSDHVLMLVKRMSSKVGVYCWWRLLVPDRVQMIYYVRSVV
mgnify:CR=1 FL=1